MTQPVVAPPVTPPTITPPVLRIGKLVLYAAIHDSDGDAFPPIVPALVTQVNSDSSCSLTLFYPTRSVYLLNVPFSSIQKPGMWCWSPEEGGPSIPVSDPKPHKPPKKK